jgi:hypothetical protein
MCETLQDPLLEGSVGGKLSGSLNGIRVGD